MAREVGEYQGVSRDPGESSAWEGGNRPLVSNTTSKVMKMNPKKCLLNLAP